MIHIELPQIASTNSYMLELLKNSTPLLEGTIISTPCQTDGRGQIGNKWESEPYQNLSFSLLLRPTFLPIRDQFIISELISLALAETVDSAIYGDDNMASHPVFIKWPNDIYHDDRKLAGILIETRLSGTTFNECVVGIGLNVNQLKFKSPAPNPVSMLQVKNETVARGNALVTTPGQQPFNLFALLTTLHTNIMKLYSDLKRGDSDHIHQRYLSRLYRFGQCAPYVDAATGQAFEGTIVDVEPSGYLVIREENHATTADGTNNNPNETNSLRRYMFKEVKFTLPCGVTKE